MNHNQFSLEGRHIIITGASSGIGRQCAIECSKQGAVITLVARNTQRLEDTRSYLSGEGHYIISQDISELDKIEHIVKEAVAKNNRVSGFVHAAGTERTLPLKMHKPSLIQELFQINTFSAFEFARILSQKKYADPWLSSFILISSIMGVVGNSGLTGYSATKGAIISAVKSMAVELSKKNIRINAISPGHIKGTAMSENNDSFLSDEAMQKITDAHPLGLGDTADIANAVVFLLSNASKWITGTNIIIDGGYSAQ